MTASVQAVGASRPVPCLDVDVCDSEADYLIDIPRAVLDCPYRCASCRHGATAHQQISDCIATTAHLVSLAVKQGHKITRCHECGGPMTHAKRRDGGSVCLRCESRPRLSLAGKRDPGFRKCVVCRGSMQGRPMRSQFCDRCAMRRRRRRPAA